MQQAILVEVTWIKFVHTCVISPLGFPPYFAMSKTDWALTEETKDEIKANVTIILNFVFIFYYCFCLLSHYLLKLNDLSARNDCRGLFNYTKVAWRPFTRSTNLSNYNFIFCKFYRFSFTFCSIIGSTFAYTNL